MLINYGKVDLSYTITEKGTVTIPSNIRKKYRLKKGSKVTFIETDEGVLFVPIVSLEELRGVDKEKKELVYAMIKEVEAERRRESEG